MQIVPIPTNQSFLKDQHQWIYSKVAQSFKRNRERIPDTVQNVCLRLLDKDFIGRWFYKHLANPAWNKQNPDKPPRDELVDRIQAEFILGGIKLAFVGVLYPVEGRRSDPNSLWSVCDLLSYARFDYERYYYSIQGHTIDSNKMLRLLGYPEGAYSSLASLYRQGKLRPAELTEHICSGKGCPMCERGRASLKARRLSLAHRWTDPKVRNEVSKLRWNDRQLKPYLREWRRGNMVVNTPEYVMRSSNFSVQAGLYKYAEILIRNAVTNDFKGMARTDDVSKTIFKNGTPAQFADDSSDIFLSPLKPNSETVSWRSEGEDEPPTRTFLDPDAQSHFDEVEAHNDIQSLMGSADLTSEEHNAIQAVDLMEMTIRQYADRIGKPVQRIHRVRSAAIKKLRGRGPTPKKVESIVNSVCNQFDCSRGELLSLSIFGKSVVARTRLFSSLHDIGMSIDEMKTYFSYPEERIVAAINRQCLQEMRSS
jgi:DNA-directed RNA polymerase specialized sigma24 family protein